MLMVIWSVSFPNFEEQNVVTPVRGGLLQTNTLKNPVLECYYCILALYAASLHRTAPPTDEP
jgi:hypothetical protein